MVEGLVYQFENWISLKEALMKKLVQLSSRSNNNPPIFLIQVFGKFRVEDEYRLK
jgi:hypothetical protein